MRSIIADSHEKPATLCADPYRSATVRRVWVAEALKQLPNKIVLSGIGTRNPQVEAKSSTMVT